MKPFMLTLLFSFLAATSATSMAQVSGPAGQDASLYVLTFDEEFNTSGLNFTKWNDHIWYDVSDPNINYDVNANGNGHLRIWPTPPFVDRTIDTDGKFSQTYGFFEIEAKLPFGKGPWPAFWLLDHSTNHRPEIDIFEAYPGGAAGGWATPDFHPNVYSATIWRDLDRRAYTVKVSTGDLSASFNKYGMKWESNRITFYFNGRQVGSANVKMSAKMYILISLWFGSASGEPDATTPTGPGNSLEVNYVRAWRFR